MQIAIISDVHDNLANLKKVLDFCAREKIGTIICCGDLATMETLDYLDDNFSGEIYYTFGNMDEEHLQNFEAFQKYKNTEIFENFGEVEIARKNAAFVHYPEEAKRLAATGRYDFVFYGHTHKPWVSYAEASDDQGQKKCTILNPGNVAGTYYSPTFAVWDTKTDKFELI